jgi:hypothetical protein
LHCQAYFVLPQFVWHGGGVQQTPPRSRRVNYRETVSNEIDPNCESEM